MRSLQTGLWISLQTFELRNKLVNFTKKLGRSEHLWSKFSEIDCKIYFPNDLVILFFQNIFI
jgi:hypothetical protein